MSKGEATRRMILEESAHLFNTRGYQNTSYKDLTARTGIQKGGIYNHFKNKEQLTLEAFELVIEKMRERSRQILSGQPHTIDRLHGVVEVFKSNIDDPFIDGGCPILNATIEANNTNDTLLQRSQAAMNEWRSYIIRTVDKGKVRGEIQPQVEGEALATIILSTLEGGIMMSQLYDDPQQMAKVATHLHTYLDSLKVETIENEA